MLGSGTVGDPYIIQDVDDLQDISLDLTAYYELGNDIECLGYDFDMLGTFTGSLDGMEFEIRDLTITVNGNGVKQGALIRTNQGIVKNLTLVDCAISITSTDDHAYAAGIAIDNEGTIQDCYVTGGILATSPAALRYVTAGGLVNLNHGAIIESYSTATVKADGYYAQAGGLLCSNQFGGTIERSFETGNVEADGDYRAWAGAFAVFNSWGTIDDSYSRGASHAHNGTDFNYAGGFLAVNESTGTITNAHSTGKPTGTTVGGFCASNTAIITSCFWDIQTSETAVSDGGTGKTTSQMKSKATFSGWDIGYSSTYRNDGYPFLSWEIGSSPIWLLYRAAGNGDEDGDEEPEPEPEPPPGVVKPSVATLPATGVS